MRHATPGVVGGSREGADAHPDIRHQANLFKYAAWIYVGSHTVPPCPHAPNGLTVVLLCFFWTENLYKQVVLTVGEYYIGDVELERREVSLMVAQVDAVEPDARCVVNALEPERQRSPLRASLLRKPAPVQHDPLIGREGIFELPMPGYTYGCPGTSYSCCFAGVVERGSERYGFPILQSLRRTMGTLRSH